MSAEHAAAGEVASKSDFMVGQPTAEEPVQGSANPTCQSDQPDTDHGMTKQDDDSQPSSTNDDTVATGAASPVADAPPTLPETEAAKPQPGDSDAESSVPLTFANRQVAVYYHYRTFRTKDLPTAEKLVNEWEGRGGTYDPSQGSRGVPSQQASDSSNLSPYERAVDYLTTQTSEDMRKAALSAFASSLLKEE